MKTLHLFAGCGGGLLSDLILGHKPIGAVEYVKHRCEALRQRSAEGWFPGLRVHEVDVREFGFGEYRKRGVDIVHAGFPCTDISAAGPGGGIKTGKRSGLWSEVVRCIGDIRPPIVFLENSPIITSRGLDIVLGGLSWLGYDARWLRLPASAVGAPHERYRWWCLAASADGVRKLELERRKWHERGRLSNGNEKHADPYGKRCNETQSEQQARKRGPEAWGSNCETADLGVVKWRQNTSGRHDNDRHDAGRKETNRWLGPSVEDVADPISDRLQIAIQQGWLSEPDAKTIEAASRYTGARSWLPFDAGVCGVLDGMADIVHAGRGQKGKRIAACGDGQVPLQAALAYALLAMEV